MSKDTYGKFYGIGQKWAVMAHYTNDGGLIYCAQCGDANLRHLEIDHMNEDGREQREKYMRGHNFYPVIIKHHYPDNWGLQVLCATCNSSKPKPKIIDLSIYPTFPIPFDKANPIPDVRPQSLWEDAPITKEITPELVEKAGVLIGEIADVLTLSSAIKKEHRESCRKCQSMPHDAHPDCFTYYLDELVNTWGQRNMEFLRRVA